MSQKLIGKIKILQVQKEPLKRGDFPNRIYDPVSITQVSKIRLNLEGVVGMLEGGIEMIDAHHAKHPRSRNNGRGNGISIGFTAHYDAMRARFGAHLPDGIAGENIIIRTDHPYTAEELSQGIVIRNEATGTEMEFAVPKAMAPCNEFSHFVNGETTGMAADRLKATLQFLDGGVRGFFALPTAYDDFEIGAGDPVFLLSK